LQLLQDLSNLVIVLVETSGCSNEDVIHVNNDVSRGNLFSEDGIHHCLECGWWIGESKEYNSRFEESSVSLEGSFPMIAFLYLDIVIFPSNIELGEPMLANKSINELFNEQERVYIPHSELIKLSIVLYWSLLAILLFNEKKGDA
jgi:hypothetical protein